MSAEVVNALHQTANELDAGSENGEDDKGFGAFLARQMHRLAERIEGRDPQAGPYSDLSPEERTAPEDTGAQDAAAAQSGLQVEKQDAPYPTDAGGAAPAPSSPPPAQDQASQDGPVSSAGAEK